MLALSAISGYRAWLGLGQFPKSSLEPTNLSSSYCKFTPVLHWSPSSVWWIFWASFSVLFSYRSEDECVKDYRDRDRDFERDREYERAQREKLRRQEEERRRQKERFEKEKVFRRKEEEVKKERDLLREKGKKSDLTDFTSGMDKSEKVTKDDKKEDTIKRDRIRNKVLGFFKFMC